MAYWMILGMCTAVVWIGGISGISAQQQLTIQQIQIITDTAASICNTITAEKGYQSKVHLQEDVKSQLAGLIGKVVTVGGSGKGSLSREDYEGLARDTTVTALQGDRNCRVRVFNTMFDRISSTIPVLPSRMFAGPNQYPPKNFKAYGIVAFPARHTSGDKSRYDMICDAYVATLPHYTSVNRPVEEQMVTVWPIDTDKEATYINEIARDKVCARAVPNYGLVIAQDAIEAAKRNKAVLNGRGPFLLAWAPGSEKGQPDALVLISNLSNVVNVEDAKLVFSGWAKDIQETPDLWNNGWNMDKLKILIRLWSDRYGDEILKYFKP